MCWKKMFCFNIFILCAVFNRLSAEDDHEHEHKDVSRSILVDKIAEHIEATSKSGDHTVFVFQDIQKLFNLLSFQNCSKASQSSKCNLCVTPEDVLKWYGHNSSKQLSEEELRELAVGLVYFLSEHYYAYEKLNSVDHVKNNSAVCKTFTTQILANRTSDLFNLYLRKYDANGPQLTEESLEHILVNINKSIGHQLTSKKCFSAHDVLEGANVSAKGFGEHDFEYVSTFIILQLIEKTCITEEEHTKIEKKAQVDKEYFISELFEEYGDKTHMGHEGFEKLYSKLFPTNNTSNSTEKHDDHDEPDGDDGHEGHDHRKRRSVEAAKKCHSAENILDIFGVAEGAELDHQKFEEICPSLVQQLESGTCHKAVLPKSGGKSTKTKERKQTWEPWVAAMLAIAIISFGSLIGAVIFPGKEKKWFPYVIMFLIALGVSVLVCDAVLHLIPHALNLHGHEEKEEGHEGHGHEEEDPFKRESYLWKCLLVLGGIYLFFAFEILMHAFARGHSHSHHGAHAHDHHEMAMGSPVSADSLKVVATSDIDPEDVIIPNDKAHKGTKEVGIDYPTKISIGGVKVVPADQEDVIIANDFAVKYKNGVANGGIVVGNGHTPKDKNRFKVRDVKSIAWMILIGDGVHNFMDGVAIGVAFSETFPAGLHGGISTSIAILCHEIPHELSDFAVLIASGLSIKQSLVMNLISSLTAFAGGIVGVSVGTNWDAAPWIFSVTAGLFIYIALVDMLPEVMNSPLLKKTPVLSIVLDIFGLLIGLVIMFVLAAWEEDIKNAWS